MSRKRQTVAVLCIALVVFSAFLPAGSSDIVWAVLTPLWLIVPAADVTFVTRTASRCDDRPVALLSLVLLRAPPLRLCVI
ncbi:MAG TPA: hypothetical protein VEL79_16415 [Vicinamibacterales bacterium]|nr:hypothetical protein [Vicinamibacterales bacterium]